MKELCIVQNNDTLWTTTAGNFSTTGTCKVTFQLPKLDKYARVHTNVHVTKNNMNYDMIIDRDLLRDLKIDILLSTEQVSFKDVTIPMKDRYCTECNAFYVQEPDSMEQEMKHLRDILDCKYQPADLKAVVNSCDNLDAVSYTHLTLPTIA